MDPMSFTLKFHPLFPMFQLAGIGSPGIGSVRKRLSNKVAQGHHDVLTMAHAAYQDSE